MITPFKTEGIYARKINPEKELTNFKSTRFGSMWKAAIGKKEEAFYEIIWFSENDSLTNEVSEENKYCAGYSCMSGEIFRLADWHKNRGCVYAKYKNVVFDEKRVEFSDGNVEFKGFFKNDIFSLFITDRDSLEDFIEKYRYIPWI